jgi:hypothetical protein
MGARRPCDVSHRTRFLCYKSLFIINFFCTMSLPNTLDGLDTLDNLETFGTVATLDTSIH